MLSKSVTHGTSNTGKRKARTDLLTTTIYLKVALSKGERLVVVEIGVFRICCASAITTTTHLRLGKQCAVPVERGA